MGMPSRRFQKIREAAREAVNESAFIKGTQETSGLEKGIYIDTDKLNADADDPDIAQKFIKHLDEQVPGAADAMLAWYNDERDEPVSMRELAITILSKGPAAASFMINDEKYGATILPNSDFDTKEELIRVFIPFHDEDAQDKIISNMPGNDKDWNRAVGLHEGDHQNTNIHNTLPDETRADRAAIAKLTPEMALAWQDIRSLAENGLDPIHATGALLNTGDQVSSLHRAVAQSYRGTIDNAVNSGFNWDTYKGDASSAETLLEENPDAYFSFVDQEIKETKETAMEGYNKDPNYETVGNVVGAQILVDYIKNFEGAHRRRALGQDVPVHEPTQMISQAEEDKFYGELHIKEVVNVEQSLHIIELDESIDITEKSFEGFDWDDYTGEATEPLELRGENPAMYFDVKQKYLDELKDQAIAQHTENPTPEATQNLIEAQIHMNQHIVDMQGYWEFDAEEPYKGEELKPVELIPEDDVDAFYMERNVRKEQPESEQKLESKPPVSEENHKGSDLSAQGSKGYEDGVNGSAYTAQVSGLEQGEPTVDFKEGTIKVGDTTMGDVFAQSTNPDPNNVTLVDARIPAPEDPVIAPLTFDNTALQLS
ncbi:MAG: hypothetical protein COB14_05160 [Alphaproteobacteria bacterium]|nr:MAG: hypothetical protein COB14_05160 [Alphaproteobacteria bacterium]